MKNEAVWYVPMLENVINIPFDELSFHPPSNLYALNLNVIMTQPAFVNNKLEVK